jgi:endonuclease/exonuclease/phosphatase family metal-dependent hydrolase
MSQNIRCGEDGNGNNIDDRKVRFVKLMKEYSPDLLGTQEATSKWMGIFKNEFGDEYGIVGCSRDGENATSGEWNAILYKKSRFELRESGTFWLTDTPHTPSFTVEGASHRRICTWALLYDKVTEQEILFCNTHLDHQSDEIRVKQTEHLMSFMDQYVGKYPIFLTGDFNAAVGSGPYNKVVGKLSDCHKKAELDLSDVKGTFHGYSSTPKSEIDFCFYDKSKADAITYRILDDWYSGYVSDHYGVIGHFVLK